MPGALLDDFATYGEAVSRQIAGVVSAHTERLKTPKRMRRKLRTGSVPNMLPYEVGTPAVVRLCGVERPLAHR